MEAAALVRCGCWTCGERSPLCDEVGEFIAWPGWTGGTHSVTAVGKSGCDESSVASGSFVAEVGPAGLLRAVTCWRWDERSLVWAAIDEDVVKAGEEGNETEVDKPLQESQGPKLPKVEDRDLIPSMVMPGSGDPETGLLWERGVGRLVR